MEMTACIEGLKSLKKTCAVTLFSDSSYVVNAMEKGWARRWKAKDWQRTPEQKALNADLWQQMLELCEKHQVAFNWVKGHAGNEHNERCDRLAVKAASKSNLLLDEAYEQAEKEKKEEKKSETETNPPPRTTWNAPNAARPWPFGIANSESFTAAPAFPTAKAPTALTPTDDLSGPPPIPKRNNGE